MNPCADMIDEYETGIKSLGDRIKELRGRNKPPSPADLERIHNLEALQYNMENSLRSMKEYEHG